MFGGIFQWISSHHNLLTVLTNAAMLAVWVVYAQLLLRTYKQQRKPRMVISSSTGKKGGSRILACNLSARAVFVETVMLRLSLEGDKKTERFIDESVVGQEELDGLFGSVQPGKAVELGPILGLIANAWQEKKESLPVEDYREVEIVVIGFYAENRIPFAAGRRFNFAEIHQDRCTLNAKSVYTHHWVTPRERKEVCCWLERYYSLKASGSGDE
ncbi:MAG: hypothetical protein Q7P63_12675 [Verrucomicrobiota bacterium JB022]|nr:hypothetical protein [Verrucomicrobiota bacterium JB022]